MANKGNISVKSDKKTDKNAKKLKHPILEMEKAFDRFFGNGWELPNLHRFTNFPAVEIEGSRLPKVDVIDRKNEMLVRAEVPGLNKKDVEVTLNDNVLLVKGHANSEKEQEEGEYHRHEIYSSSFARAIAVPNNIDESNIAASLEDVVLKVTLPKTKSTKKRAINIQ